MDVTILKRPIYVPQAILPSPSSEQIFAHTELKGHASKCCESQSNMWVRTSGARFFGINLRSIMWVEWSVSWAAAGFFFAALLCILIQKYNCISCTSVFLRLPGHWRIRVFVSCVNETVCGSFRTPHRNTRARTHSLTGTRTQTSPLTVFIKRSLSHFCLSSAALLFANSSGVIANWRFAQRKKILPPRFFFFFCCLLLKQPGTRGGAGPREQREKWQEGGGGGEDGR